MTKRRFTDKSDLDPSAVWSLPEGHAALEEDRTLFPSTVVDVDENFEDRLLISGENNRKLGKSVVKGKFKGYALYQLSLEERATCPKDCALATQCYGNAMQLARRHRIVDLDYFAVLLEDEIRDILSENDGLLVRVHVLGDFMSVEYVELWGLMLSRYENLACYGYTHRKQKVKGGDKIGDAIQALKTEYPDRFRIRWSSESPGPDSSIVIDEIPDGPKYKGAIVCPAQTDATACCASCGLCWESTARKETIAFIKHGKRDMNAAAEAATQKQKPLSFDKDFAGQLVALTPKLKAFAFKLTQNRTSAEDLVSETMLKALTAKAQFEPGTNLGAWVMTIMRNYFMSERRKDGREIEDVDGEISGRVAVSDDSAARMEAIEGLEAFDMLPADQRDLIKDIADGHSYESVGEKYGIAVGTVKSRVARGRAELAALIDSGAKGQAEPSITRSTNALHYVRGIDMPSGMKPSAIREARPTIRFVSPKDLQIESAYQRDLSAKSIKLIRKIVASFEWAKFKPPVCAETKDGLFVIDGQHSAIAAATHPDIKEIPVLVVATQLIENRAGAFVSHNRDRLVMTPAQIFYGDLAAGDKNARTVMEVCVKTGASIPRLPVGAGRAKPGQVFAVGELRDQAQRLSRPVFERIVRIAVMSKSSPIGKSLLRALRELLTVPIFEHVAKSSDEQIAKAIATFDNVDKAARQAAAQMEISQYAACAKMIADKVR